MFTANPFHRYFLVALCLPGVALVSLPIGGPQGRVPVQPAPAARQVIPGTPPAPGDVEGMLAVAMAARMPAGAILPYAGETPPPGYLLCDGSELLRADFPALFDAIGTAWGFDTSFTFTLPDLRGRFLRGVDGGAGNDPDALSRSAINPGGNVGDGVGSAQGDARRGISGTVSGTTASSGGHIHNFPTWNDDHDEDDGDPGSALDGWADDKPGGSSQNNPTDSQGAHTHTFSVPASFPGDAETRPKNANVNFIIKL